MKELNDKVRNILSNVDEGLYPRIAETVKTDSGLNYVADMMINMMIDNRMTPGATIYHIEQRL